MSVSKKNKGKKGSNKEQVTKAPQFKGALDDFEKFITNEQSEISAAKENGNAEFVSPDFIEAIENMVQICEMFKGAENSLRLSAESIKMYEVIHKFSAFLQKNHANLKDYIVKTNKLLSLFFDIEVDDTILDTIEGLLDLITKHNRSGSNTATGAAIKQSQLKAIADKAFNHLESLVGAKKLKDLRSDGEISPQAARKRYISLSVLVAYQNKLLDYFDQVHNIKITIPEVITTEEESIAKEKIVKKEIVKKRTSWADDEDSSDEEEESEEAANPAIPIERGFNQLFVKVLAVIEAADAEAKAKAAKAKAEAEAKAKAEAEAKAKAAEAEAKAAEAEAKCKIEAEHKVTDNDWETVDRPLPKAPRDPNWCDCGNPANKDPHGSFYNFRGNNHCEDCIYDFVDKHHKKGSDPKNIGITCGRFKSVVKDLSSKKFVVAPKHHGTSKDEPCGLCSDNKLAFKDIVHGGYAFKHDGMCLCLFHAANVFKNSTRGDLLNDCGFDNGDGDFILDKKHIKYFITDCWGKLKK